MSKPTTETLTQDAIPPASTTQLGSTAQAAAVAQETNSSSQASSILHASLRSTPPKIVSANGNYLYTESGYSILDATGGAAVACLGHNHPRVKAAINKQLETGVAYAYSPFFATQAAEELGKRLVSTMHFFLPSLCTCFVWFCHAKTMIIPVLSEKHQLSFRKTVS